MIIFGTGSRVLATSQLPDVECPSCEQKTLTGHVYSKYFDLFWIPVFPYSKKAVIECSHCKFVGEEKDIPMKAMGDVIELKQRAKTPAWLFIGSLLLVAFISTIVYVGKTTSEENARNTALWLQQPQANDYHILLGENPEDPAYKYFVYRVDSLAGDSLILSISDYVYRGIADAAKAINSGYTKADDYFGDQYIIAFNDLNTDDVKRVIRPD